MKINHRLSYKVSLSQRTNMNESVLYSFKVMQSYVFETNKKQQF